MKEANEQNKIIIGALRATAPMWEFEQIIFDVGNCGSFVESDFYTKLKKLDVQERKKDKLFADHVTRVCKAHNWVILSFLQQVQGFARPHRGIQGECWTQCARVRRWGEEHMLIERQSWGPSNDSGLGMVNWESQSKTPPMSGGRTH